MNKGQTISTLLGVAAGAILVTTLPALADVDSTGAVPDQPLPPPTTAIDGACEILWFGTPGAGFSRFQGLGFNITQTLNPADVNPANLSNFDVLVVSLTGSGVLGGAQPDIEAYVNGGHSLLIHQPNFVGTTDYAPTNFNVTISDIVWCNFPLPISDHAATIVDPSHPITMALTDADLSGDFDLVSAIGSGYTVLAENAVCSDPALAAGTSGSGRVVFETGNGSFFSLDPGSDQYWINVLTWLCEAEPVVQVDLDIKPGSCPNSFNRNSHGVLPVALVGMPDFDPAQVDLSTVRMSRADAEGGEVAPHEGPPGPHSVLEDVATPFGGEPCDCHALGGDGIDDLLMHFATPEVVAELELFDVDGGTELELCVSGTLLDGTSFDACDCVRLVPPGDIDGDGVVGVPDILALLGAWGPCPNCSNCPADVDGDCQVGVTDLLILLGNWGSS